MAITIHCDQAGKFLNFTIVLFMNPGIAHLKSILFQMKILFLSLFNIIAMTAATQLPPVTSGVFHWADLPVKKDNQRESRKLVEGTTREFEYFEIHATTQEKGAVPRPPHAQKDIEEVIIVKEGSMKCTIGSKTAMLGAGGVLLIPPLEMQTFENVGDGPLTYYVLMFRSRKPMDIDRSIQAGGVLLLNADSLEFKQTERGGTRKYFDRPTAMCERYEMHVTQLAHKGPSHAPHQHTETEIILMIDGNTSMTIDGVTYTGDPGDLYIMESGKLHGISNASDKPCSYFAFKWK
jgi:quercetin dioxygenase-like cupin family protein